MKSVLSIILPIFLFVAIFGFALICDHSQAGTHHSFSSKPECFLSMISDCVNTVESMAISHIEAYQSFFSAKVQALYLFISIIFLFGILLQGAEHNAISNLKLARVYSENNKGINHIHLRKKIRWISLFENSPTI